MKCTTRRVVGRPPVSPICGVVFIKGGILHLEYNETPRPCAVVLLSYIIVQYEDDQTHLRFREYVSDNENAQSSRYTP